MDTETWLLFIAAAGTLAITPGPGMLYVLSRTLAGGRSQGLASTLGAAVGGSVHVVGAALGISAILATSATAFTLVKWLGAVFLLCLGIKMLYSAFGEEEELTINSRGMNTGNFLPTFLQGILSEVLNPKTAIFFLAFIPQFVRPQEGPVFSQFLMLGIIVVALNAVPDLLIVLLSKPVERLWRSSYRFRAGQRITSGLCLIGLGIYLALTDNRKAVSAGS